MTGPVETTPTTPAANSSSRAPVGYLLAAAAVGAGGVWSSVVTIRHWDQAVYAMPSGALAVALAAVTLALAGAVGMVRVRRHDVALLSGLVALLLLAGLLAIFSVGLLLLLAGGGLAIAVGRRSSGAGPWPVVCGAAMAVGLGTATLVAIQPPLVDCRTNGVSTASSIWSGSGGSSSGSSSGGPGGDSTGTITQGSRSYSFTCRGDHLVELRSTSDSDR